MDAPCNRDPVLKTYVKVVRDDIHWALNSGPLPQMRDNLTRHREEGFSFVEIKFQDCHQTSRQSSAMAMSRQDYLNKVVSQLQNEKFYLKLDNEPTLRYAKEFMCFLAEMTDRQANDKETFKHL